MGCVTAGWAIPGPWPAPQLGGCAGANGSRLGSAACDGSDTDSVSHLIGKVQQIADRLCCGGSAKHRCGTDIRHAFLVMASFSVGTIDGAGNLRLARRFAPHDRSEITTAFARSTRSGKRSDLQWSVMGMFNSHRRPLR
jgi:hypothetical protein